MSAIAPEVIGFDGFEVGAQAVTQNRVTAEHRAKIFFNIIVETLYSFVVCCLTDIEQQATR